MKLLKILFISVIVLFVVSYGAVFASNNVSQIDISVVVKNDGSADVIQKWTGEFNEGTENYIPINTGDIKISDLKVSDEKRAYDYVDSWNVDADFNKKKNKCGINKTDDGVELCFGISEYGKKTYTIEYTVTDMIKSYSDYDGTNFMFVNPNMSTFPTDGNIQIVLENGTALNEENAGVWAFGYDGEICFDNGAVSAYTTSALDGDNSMIVLLRLNKGIITPAASVSKSFDEVKDKAFEGSDYGYEEASLFEEIIGYVVLIGIPLLIILLIVRILTRKREIKKFYNNAQYFRDIPNGGNVEMSHYLSRTFDVSGNDSLILGALLLKMINQNYLEPQTETTVGMFGKQKQTVNLKLVKEPEDNELKRLYKLLSFAAGDDGILQEKELEKYAYKNPKKINKFIDDAKLDGELAFETGGGFVSGTGNRIKDLSDKGKAELAEVMGLKKYLDEFSLIAEREINELTIWQDYMIYATLFGIADKVIKQMKKVYPDKIPEIDNYNRNVIIAYSYYHGMHNSMQRAMQEQRTSGAGGHASLGGGGGFSGGGSGGGSR